VTIRKGDTVTINGEGTVEFLSMDGQYADISMQDGSFLEDVPVTSLNVVAPWAPASVNELVRSLPPHSIFTVNAYGDPANTTTYVKLGPVGTTQRKIISSPYDASYVGLVHGDTESNRGTDNWATGLDPVHANVLHNPEEDR
jgi:hypothetical protein